MTGASDGKGQAARHLLIPVVPARLGDRLASRSASVPDCLGLARSTSGAALPIRWRLYILGSSVACPRIQLDLHPERLGNPAGAFANSSSRPGRRRALGQVQNGPQGAANLDPQLAGLGDQPVAQLGAAIGLKGLGQPGNPGAVDLGQAGVQPRRRLTRHSGLPCSVPTPAYAP